MINQLLIFILQALRPLLGPARCKFEPTCGNYAILQLKTQPLPQAIMRTCKRLLACSPCT